MNKFLKIILVFLIPVLIVGVVMEVLLQNIPNIYSYKSEYISTNKKEIETLLLGSSHTLYDLDPTYFDSNTFNAGHVSQTLDIDYTYLQYYIHNLPELKTVVLRLSYTTLFEKLGETNEDWRSKNYTIYYPFNSSNKLVYHSEVLSVKFKNNVSELCDYYLKTDMPIEWNQLGWGTELAEEKVIDLDKAGERAAARHTIENHEFLPELKSTLDLFIRLCEENNINVILFTAPAFDTYREHLDKNQYQTMMSIGEKMDNKYLNCRYFNFIDDSLFLEEDFYDADHLNPKGAKKMSLLMNTLVNQ
ncbi:MAG: hypothetical protein JKY22_06550 [Flavobacteriaceae bacterium]|nr:hypothetical protein [Flavobacteriaceae bacterium]